MRFRNVLMSFFVFLLMGAPCFAITEREEFDAWLKKTHGETRTFVEWRQLTPGMVGYCITVLGGTGLSVNELEYVAVTSHPLTDIEKVLLFKIGKPLTNVSAVAGMSGSPVYVKHGGEWKLVGAYSYGFNQLAPDGEYLAGITPIKAMLDKNTALGGTTTDVNKHVSNISISGLGEFSVKPLVVFTKTASGRSLNGFSDTVFMDIERDPRPGDAVSVLLASGDFMYYATGTVTYVDLSEKTFYAFGHPFLSDFGIGKVELPAHRAEIATTVKSRLDAHKLPARLLEHFGTIEKDGIFAIEGSIGPRPNIFLPISLQLIVDGRQTSYRFNVVRQKVLTPVIVMVGMKTLVNNMYSLESLTMGIMKSTMIFGDNTSLSWNDTRFSEPKRSLSPFAPQPASLFSDFATKISLIVGGDWNFDVREIKTVLSFTSHAKSLFIDSGAVVNAEGRPITSVKRGETFYVVLGVRTLDNSARYTIRIPYAVPSDVPVSGITLFKMFIQSGTNYENQAFVPPLYAPDSASEFLSLFKTFFSGSKDPNKLYLQFVFASDTAGKEDKHFRVEGKDLEWVSPTTLEGLRAKGTKPRVVEKVIDGPTSEHFLDVNASVRLIVEK